MFKPKRFILLLCLTTVISSIFVIVSWATPGDTIRVSIGTDGAQANDEANWPSISPNGKHVTFDSFASNLVLGGTTGLQVFIRHIEDGTTELVSATSTGQAGDGWASNSDVSMDGTYVVFRSDSTNLVANDTNNVEDVFLRNTQTDTTIRISVSSSNVEGNDLSTESSVSNDGRYVAFSSRASNLIANDTNDKTDIFLRDTMLGTTIRVSEATSGTEADDHSFYPKISADGRYILYSSIATNLVSGDTNSLEDVFIHDTVTGTTSRISTSSDSSEGDGRSYDADISADNRYVVFNSSATNLISGDSNGESDIFLKDLATGLTTRVSVASDGTESNGDSFRATITTDGKFVVFDSNASNLTEGDTNDEADIFLHSILLGTTTRISISSDGAQGNDRSSIPTISANGRFVTFLSSATNLIDDDTNFYPDVFLHENDIVPPAVLSITRASPSPTILPSVDFTVTFSETVVDVDATDFAISTTDTLVNTSVESVSGSGGVYTVTVSTGQGSGTLQLIVPVTATITDSAGNPLANLPYLGGEAYEIGLEIFLPIILSPSP